MQELLLVRTGMVSVFTSAVIHRHFVNPVGVEGYEAGVGALGGGTLFVKVVAELDTKTEGCQRSLDEETVMPSLWLQSAQRSTKTKSCLPRYNEEGSLYGCGRCKTCSTSRRRNNPRSGNAEFRAFSSRSRGKPEYPRLLCPHGE